MKSPFPGMDPYLEEYWWDVHARLIVYACDQIQPRLPGDLRIHVEAHVTVESPPEANGESKVRQGSKYPDLRVLEHPKGTPHQPDTATLVVAEPLVIPRQLEMKTERSLRIVDTRSGNRVVTAIEILSPANKVGNAGREAYRQKQDELLDGGVSLVEIDLLREGHHVLAVSAELLPFTHLSPYRVCVVRGWRPGQGEVYVTKLKDRLPTFRVPLRESDPDVLLNLQELIDKSYENGGYAGYIDYTANPQPPLQGDDAIWANELLREKGLR